MRRQVRGHDERGFTLVELLITVLIIGILIALALPTFLGTRARAEDKRAMADIRIAFTAERAYYTDSLTYTVSNAQMTAIESAMTYLDGDTPLTTGAIYLHIHPASNEIFISTRSQSGTCFYLAESDGHGATYASSSTCDVADSQVFTSAW